MEPVTPTPAPGTDLTIVNGEVANNLSAIQQASESSAKKIGAPVNPSAAPRFRGRKKKKDRSSRNK